jgi:dihydrofolate reductase
MGKLIVNENASLDGIVQDPTGEEGGQHGNWSAQIGDSDRQAWAQLLLEEALGAEALLLGRRSYEWFAARWLSRSGAWADRLNKMPKYVVSGTLTAARWGNSTVLAGGALDEVSKLKRELPGDIVVYGSFQLGRTLLEHDLVDELRLTVYPVVLGSGMRIFGGISDKKPLRLLHARPLGDSLATLAYEPACRQ